MTKYISFKIEEKDIPLVKDLTKKLGIEISESPNPKNEDEMREWAMNFFSESSSFWDASKRVSGQRKPASASELEEAKKFMMNHTNGFKGIPDPSAWQREIRQDRPLPGRE
jgi:hypothetical protein